MVETIGWVMPPLQGLSLLDTGSMVIIVKRFHSIRSMQRKQPLVGMCRPFGTIFHHNKLPSKVLADGNILLRR